MNGAGKLGGRGVLSALVGEECVREYFRLDLTALSDEVRLLGGGDNYMK
ncbi:MULTISPECIES: hypothetical protein [unclassified Bartonella]